MNILKTAFNNQESYNEYMRSTGWEPQTTFVADFTINLEIGENPAGTLCERVIEEFENYKEIMVELRVSLDYLSHKYRLSGQMKQYENILQAVNVFENWLFTEATEEKRNYILKETN